VDEEIKRILAEAYDRAVQALQKHRDGLDRVAQELFEKGEIPGKEVVQLVGVKKPQPPAEKPVSIEGTA
jgi:cell division protease FtsH